MADRRHFEKPLNWHNSPTVGRIAMKVGMITHYKPSDGQNFDFLKSKMADDHHLKTR